MVKEPEVDADGNPKAEPKGPYGLDPYRDHRLIRRVEALETILDGIDSYRVQTETAFIQPSTDLKAIENYFKILRAQIVGEFETERLNDEIESLTLDRCLLRFFQNMPSDLSLNAVLKDFSDLSVEQKDGCIQIINNSKRE